MLSLDIDFVQFLLGFWASKLELTWPSWTPWTVSKASKIQSFKSTWLRCFQRGSKSGSKEVPRRAQRSVLEGFSRFLVFLWCLYELLIVMPHCRCWHVVTLCFFAAVADVILHLPAMFLQTFWCGGLCAAHGIRRTAQRCPGVSNQYDFNRI